MDKQGMDELLSKEFLTVPEVMQLFGISQATVGNKIRKGHFEAFNMAPNEGRPVWRIWTRSLKKLMGIDEQVPA
jgi:hypothetical protein